MTDSLLIIVYIKSGTYYDTGRYYDRIHCFALKIEHYDKIQTVL